MNRYFKVLKPLAIALAIAGLMLLFPKPPAALAHRPHDVVSHIVVSPDYEQDQTLWIVVRGSLFKSQDGGMTWTRITQGLFSHDYSALAGTDDNRLFLAALGDGLYKSTDAGDSWQRLEASLKQVQQLAIAPRSPALLFAADAERGLYRTQDGGDTWDAVLPEASQITAMAFYPDSDRQLLVADDQGRLYTSMDGGDTWATLPPAPALGMIHAIAISPTVASDQTFWVGTHEGLFQTRDAGQSFTPIQRGLTDRNIQDIELSPQFTTDQTLFVSTWRDGVFRSTDAGASWRRYDKGLTRDPQADEEQYQVPHFTDLTLSPVFQRDRTLFLAGFDGIFKSTSAAQLWDPLDSLSTRTVVALSLSPSYGEDGTLAVATYVGEAYLSRDRGTTWAPIQRGLTDADRTQAEGRPRFYDIALAPNFEQNQTVFSTLLWKFVNRSTDGGQRWTMVHLEDVPRYARRGLKLILSPDFAADQTLFVMTQQGMVYQSVDGGASFEIVGQTEKRSGNQPPSVVISPAFATDRTLFAYSPQGIDRSTDGGKTWQPVAADTAIAQATQVQLAISPDFDRDRTLFVATDLGLFKTDDAGATWTRLGGQVYGETAYLEAIGVSPAFTQDQTLLVSVRGQGLFKSTDGGRSFIPVGDNRLSLSRMGNVPSAGVPIQFSPAYATDQTVYGFGSAAGELYRSTDGGNTWETVALPPAATPINPMRSLHRWGLRIAAYPLLRAGVAAIASGAWFLLVQWLRAYSRWKQWRWVQPVGTGLVFLLVLVLFSW